MILITKDVRQDCEIIAFLDQLAATLEVLEETNELCGRAHYFWIYVFDIWEAVRPGVPCQRPGTPLSGERPC